MLNEYGGLGIFNLRDLIFAFFLLFAICTVLQNYTCFSFWYYPSYFLSNLSYLIMFTVSKINRLIKPRLVGFLLLLKGLGPGSSCGPVSQVKLKPFRKIFNKNSFSDTSVIICISFVRSREKPFFRLRLLYTKTAPAPLGSLQGAFFSENLAGFPARSHEKPEPKPCQRNPK